jgi:hypothetical protein
MNSFRKTTYKKIPPNYVGGDFKLFICILIL